MFFDPKVTFTEISFKREAKEGRYIQESSKFSINYEKIDSYSSGCLKLDNGEVIAIEEDHDTITGIMHQKLTEHEEYQAKYRLAEKFGVDPSELVD